MAPMPSPTQNVGQRRSRIVLPKTLLSSMAGRLSDGAVGGAVVGQEYLLEAGLDAAQVANLEPRCDFDEGIEAAHDRASEDLAVYGEVPDAGQIGERLDRDLAAEIDLEPSEGALLERGDRLDREQPALADDPDAVAQVLDFG